MNDPVAKLTKEAIDATPKKYFGLNPDIWKSTLTKVVAEKINSPNKNERNQAKIAKRKNENKIIPPKARQPDLKNVFKKLRILEDGLVKTLFTNKIISAIASQIYKGGLVWDILHPKQL